jgi:hypothetical protein
MRKLSVLLVTLALAGCYNPRYPDEGPGTDKPEMAPVQSGTGGTVNSSDGSAVQSRKR